jgi:quinol-cytochrome oxidoreductase complex cytochrome b subunit
VTVRGLWQTLVQAARRLWSDIKTSTDAGLLAVPRFFGLLYGPIDTTLPINEALDRSLRRRLPAFVGWRHSLGGISFFLFIVLVVTGVLLSVHYRPSVQEAYPSIQHIVSDITFGWLVRDVHRWAATLLVVVILAHMARVFVEAAYLPPRETNWLVGVFLLFLVMAFGGTGYLLPWDQWSYWTVSEALATLEDVPIIGGFAADVMRGDPLVSGATLSRFFAAHVIVLPWVALALLAFHFALVRRHGVAPPERPTPKQSGPGQPFYPNQLLRSFMVVALTTAILITLAVLAPRPIGDVANPEIPPEQLRSTWVVVDVSRALTHYLGAWGLALFVLLGIGLAMVPLLHRTPERSLRGRPRAAGVGLLFIVVFLAGWAVGSRLETVPPAAADEAVDVTGARADSVTSDSTADTTGAARRSTAPATRDTTPATGGKR